MMPVTTKVEQTKDISADEGEGIEPGRLYECAVLYPFPFGQKEEADLLKEVDALFAEAGAKLVSKDAWGRCGLAYAIKGLSEANVVIFYWEMDPSQLRGIDQALRIMKGVLRHLITKPPKHYQIVPYAGRYQQWRKELEGDDERRRREREEKLQAEVAEKAKRRAKQTTEKRPAEPSISPPKGTISEGIDKLIADDDLGL